MKQKLTTTNKVHSLLVAFNIIRGNRDETRAELSAAKFDLANTVVKSPVSGVISDINVDVGDMARRVGKPAIVIVKFDPILVEIEVDTETHLQIRKRQIKGLKRATEVVLTFSNGEIYSHRGTYVGSYHRVNEKTGKVSHLVSFPNPDLLIIPGLDVKVRGEFEDFDQ